MNFQYARTIAPVVVALALAAAASGQQQIVVPDPISQSATPGGAAVSFTLVYDTSNGSETTGLGVHMFFNSSQLAFVNLTNVLVEDLIALAQPEDDVANNDSDDLTDKYVNIAWTSINGTWDDGPKDLFDANFTTTGGFGSTTVRFTGATTVFYTFVSTPFTTGFATPGPSPTPSRTPTRSATPTSTRTPSPTLSPTPTATLPQQIVVPDPISQSATPGGAAVSFTLVYDTSNGSETTGLGVHMFFNSSQLAFVNLTNVLATHLVGLELQDDVANGDSDDLTDEKLIIAWVEFDDGPKDLFDANFTTTGGFGSTTVRFTGQTAAGYTFVSTPFTAGLATPTPTPNLTQMPSSTSTPSRTPTRTATLTLTPTITSTSTPTPTPSPTATNTPTPTATVTLTFTPTPTSTPAGAVVDADGDGEAEPLTDGLLILRWLFGFTAQPLVIGAVNTSDCTRCTAGEIEGYLAGIAEQLDIDDDGELVSLSDGLLILRWLFGLTGPPLVNGAVDLSDCARCTAIEIEACLDSLDG